MTTGASPPCPQRGPSIGVDVFLLWMILLLPSTGLILAHASSMTLGLFGASIIVLATELLTARRLRTGLTWRAGGLRTATFIVAGVLLQAVVLTIVWHQVDWARLVGSLIVTLVVLVAAACMRDRLLRHSSADVTRILAWTAWMLVALALRSLVGPPVFAPITHPRPVVVFAEPSHFALAFVPFAGFFIVQLRRWRRWAVVIGTIALALVLQSTTLLAGLLMLLVTCLRWRQTLVVLSLCVLVGAVANFDPSYIVDRLVFSEEVHNVSNLVLLQGWERAWLALIETDGLGLGFQQFGVWGPMGEVQDLILAVGGENLNLSDGGTTASKLVAEFGVVGIGLLLGWFVWWWRASRLLRLALKGPRQPAAVVFMKVCVVAIGVELWVRGVGYLSPGLFLLGLIAAGRSVRILPPLLHPWPEPASPAAVVSVPEAGASI